MIRKKRLVMIGAVVALLVLGALYGYGLAFLCLALLVVLLGLLQALRVSGAHRGLALLAEYSPRYNYAALISAAQGRCSGAESLRFVVLGDTRNKSRTAREVYHQAAAEKPAVIFDTGDIVRHGTAREYVNHHMPLLAIAAPAPVFCIPGNHDRGARKDWAAFKALYGDDRFSFDLGPCHFVGFNNAKHSRVDAADLEFLTNALGGTSAAHKFVLLHIPPRFFEERAGIPGKRRGFETNAAELHALLTRHQVTEVFMGHIHGYASAVIDGVRYTLTAGAGAPLSKRLPPDQRVRHYLVRHVEGTGVRREVVRRMDSAWVRTEE